MPIDPMTGAALGMVAGQAQYAQQMGGQKDLMNLQLRNQKELNSQASQLSYQNWLRTNYSAQREQMEKAGLNVGMMYGMGGAGGTLTGGSGGSAAGGQAPAPNNQMAMLLGDLAANIDLKKAQARNLNVDSDKKEGVDTDLTQTQIDANKIANNFNTQNFETALKKSEAELNNVITNTNKQAAEGKISEIDAQTRNWKNVQETLNTIADTKKMDAEVQQQWIKVSQGWKELELKNKGLNIEQQKANIQEFGAETQRNYPGVWNVVGKSINDVFKGIRGAMGYNKEGNVETTIK